VNSSSHVLNIECTSSNHKIWEVGDLGKKENVTEYLFINHGAELYCSFKSKDIKLKPQLIVGYFDETVKDREILIEENENSISIELKEL
jgi:hypothetical protein